MGNLLQYIALVFLVVALVAAAVGVRWRRRRCHGRRATAVLGVREFFCFRGVAGGLASYDAADGWTVGSQRKLCNESESSPPHSRHPFCLPRPQGWRRAARQTGSSRCSRADQWLASQFTGKAVSNAGRRDDRRHQRPAVRQERQDRQRRDRRRWLPGYRPEGCRHSLRLIWRSPPTATANG